MKRLTSMLAAGLLAAATVLATAGAASAGPHCSPPHHLQRRHPHLHLRPAGHHPVLPRST